MTVAFTARGRSRPLTSLPPKLWVGLVSLLVALGLSTAVLGRTSDILVAGALLTMALAAALRLSGVDLVLSLYLVGILAGFVVAPLARLNDIGTLALTWWLLAVWLFGWTAGATMGRGTADHRAGRKPGGIIAITHEGIGPLVLVGTVGLAIQALNIVRAESRFAAQFRGLVDTGPDALLGTAAPAAVAVCFWVTRTRPAPASMGTRLWTLSALALQTVLLALSGFRAAAPSYLIIVWLLGRSVAAVPPRAHRVRQAAGLLACIAALFVIASYQRTELASSLGRRDAAAQRIDVRRLPDLVAQRLDYSAPVGQALRRADDPRARETVSAVAQAATAVPRALWPSKPVNTYGQDVAEVFFDIPRSSNSAETITWLGDLYVQGRAPIVLAVGLLTGFAAVRLLRLARSLSPTYRLLVVYAVTSTLFNLEAPLLLAVAHSLRVLGLLYLLTWAMGRLGRARRGTELTPVQTNHVSLA